jgi:hypothetical protein
MPQVLELAPPVLAPPELVAVQMLLLYAPPEPVICCHILPVACCCAIAVLAPPELALLASPELTPYFRHFEGGWQFVPDGCGDYGG